MEHKRYTVRDERGGVFAYEAVNRRHAIVQHVMARMRDGSMHDYHSEDCVKWSVSDCVTDAPTKAWDFSVEGGAE